MLISFMTWKIGNIIDIYDQIKWVKNAEFPMLSFHAHKGDPPNWMGIEPKECDEKERKHIKKLISQFKAYEIHAPFEYELTPYDNDIVEKLKEIIVFANDIGVKTITVHADINDSPDDSENKGWQNILGMLNEFAGKYGIKIGIEVTKGFDLLTSFGYKWIGITLDVGHMYLNDKKPLIPFNGSIGNVVKKIGKKHLFHIHLHDVLNETDHIEIGTGCVDYDGLFKALAEINYTKGICLELNPGRVDINGMLRSKEKTEEYIKKYKDNV